MKLDPHETQRELDAIKPSKKRSTLWLSTYIFIAVGAITFYILFQLHIFDLLGEYRTRLQKFSLAVLVGALILIASKFIQISIHNHSDTKFAKYNLLRLTKLLTIILIVIAVISLSFANLYATAVSLGLISLILGFALQTPISSFIGWVYIIIRTPYKIGDRIQINDFRGDVIQIGYVDTTLWEFAGDYLSNDLPTGRLIKFPNSLVLQSPVYNYSWENFRFIWNEIPFHVAYESDLDFVATTIKDVTSKELGPQMADRIEKLKELVKDSPIDEMQIKEYPFVTFRINANTWVEVSVTYLVPPRQAAAFRTKIIHAILTEFNKAPEKVLFPNSNSR